MMNLVRFSDDTYAARQIARAPGLVIHDRQIRRHRAIYAWAAPPDFQRLERMSECVIDGCPLVTAVRHAVVALRIATDTVVIPVGILDQLPERRRIAFVDEQIAGFLPTEYIAAWHGPSRTLVRLIAADEIEKQAGL